MDSRQADHGVCRVFQQLFAKTNDELNRYAAGAGE